MLVAQTLLISILSLTVSAASIPAVSIEERGLKYCPGLPSVPLIQEGLFKTFVNEFFIQKNVKGAYDTYVSETVIEHDPSIADGRDAGIKTLTPLINTVSFDIVHVVFENGLGVVHSKVTIPGAPFMAIADFFRYDGTCIVEHWDVSQSVPAGAISSHPLF